VTVRTLGLEGGGGGGMNSEIPYRLERGMKHFFYKGVKTSP